MDGSDNEIVGLMVQQSEDEARDNLGAKKGGRYVQSAFPGGPTKKVPGAMFGPRRFLPPDNYVSSKAAPGPQGPDAATLIEDAKRRRRERAEDERSQRGR